MSVLTVGAGTQAGICSDDIRTREKGPTLLQLSCLVFSIKALLLLLDPYPSFHFGDSGAYLATALTKWIPPDRSFVYGFLLRPLVLQSHSLIPVVLVQTLLSGIASIVVGLLLIEYFNTRKSIALCFSVLCAIEPLQLMSERFIMTEAFATFGFSLFVWACLQFLKTGGYWMLALAQLLGVTLVSLRYSFLPVVLMLSVALPLLSKKNNLRVNGKTLLIRLTIAVVISQCLLFGYRHLYGFLAHTKPAYLSRDGDFLIADVAPLIRPEDFPIPGERDRLFHRITVPFTGVDVRRLHRWAPGGLCDAILQVSHGDEEVANGLARTTALRAIKRDPIGVFGLGAATYRDFLSYKRIKWALDLDSGHFVSPTDNDVAMIQRSFGADARRRRFDSATKRWERLAIPWCWLIAALPILYLIHLAVHRRQVSRYDMFLWLTATAILLTAVVPVEIANPRYLVPLPWLSILILGAMYSRWRGLRRYEA